MPDLLLEYIHTHRVRYRETDPMKIVYHTHYLDYFEVARTEALRSLGLPYKSLEDAGIIMPVVDLSLNFRSPARYDDVLEIRTVMTASPTITRVTFNYETRRKNETEILVTGHVTLCFIDVERNRPIRAPESFRDVLEKLFSAQKA